MTACGFTVDHYRDLLGAARAGGYRLAGFDRTPEPGDLFLRHDVDLSLQAAVRLAEVEHDAGVWSTWCLMTRSVFYNLDSQEGDRAIERIRALGGRIAHHAVWPHLDLDDRFELVMAWHNPDYDYVHEPVEGTTNVMSPVTRPSRAGSWAGGRLVAPPTRPLRRRSRRPRPLSGSVLHRLAAGPVPPGRAPIRSSRPPHAQRP